MVLPYPLLSLCLKLDTHTHTLGSVGGPKLDSSGRGEESSNMTSYSYILFFWLQVRNHSNVNLRDVTEDLPTPVIVKSTAMFTPVTNPTIVKFEAVISHIPIHPV